MPEETERIRAIVEEKKIVEPGKPIWKMRKAELLEHFAAESSGRPVAKKIVRAIIWQAYRWIRDERMRPIQGNVRTFWYRFIKLPLGRVGLLDTRTDHYQTMLQVFSELVKDADLFHYTEFGFDDDNWENRRIGAKHPTVIVFAEKTGFMRFLKEQVHEVYDVTVVALSGWPSLLSSEYMGLHIQEAAGFDPPARVWDEITVPLFSIVDWDTTGWYIARAFIEQLQDVGLQRYELHNLIHPKHYAEDELEFLTYPLPDGPRQKEKNRTWLANGGGIDGELLGLEADSLPRQRLAEILARQIPPHLERGSPGRFASTRP